MSEQYIGTKEAKKLTGVTTRTLINWDTDGKVRTIRTKGGRRRYLLEDILKKNDKNDKNNQISVCYCRVSSHGQKEDLQRQVDYFRQEYPNHEIVKDIGSGINFKRKGFNSLLEQAIKGNIREIVVTHKDRLCRFAFDLIEGIVRRGNGKILVLDQKETSPQEELVNDLLSIVTVFSSRLYGLRSHKLKRKIKKQALKNSENEDIPHGDRETETTIHV
jgi:predicted site-specific integrase-resolvase